MAFETAKKITEEGLESLKKYYSIYRAIVVDNEDPKNMNRVEICCPAVMGGIMAWAYPKGQHGTTNGGFKWLAPKVGDIVWVTFEYGDPTKPVWEYHGWGAKQMPTALNDPNTMGIVTPNGNIIIINDDNGTLTLKLEGDISIVNKGSTMLVSNGDTNVASIDGVLYLNDGKNEGLINIKSLTDKLNGLVRELENLRNLFNTHTHGGVTTGPGFTSPTTSMAPAFSEFKQRDYEDTKVIH